MKRRLMIIGLVISSLVLACGWALATPNTLQYQGRLTDAAGIPLNGLQTVTFAIYADSTVVGNIWTETRSVTVVNGLFNIVLGTGTPFPNAAFNGADRFLGIRVGLDAEMTPRQRIASIPYALRSGAVDNVPGISQGKFYGGLFNRVDFGTATAGTHVDIVTTTITTPASGYIEVEAGGQIGLLNPATIISYQIDETAGGSDDRNYYNFAGSTTGSFDGYLPVTAHRLYFKAAGTYAFRLEARNEGGAGSPYFWNPYIIARYFGTNYGGVTTEPPDGPASVRGPSDGRQK